MLRRTLTRRYGTGDWQEKALFPRDGRGRFNMDEAAAELGLESNYVKSLYKPLHYTYYVKDRRYPSERGRTSRPGGVAASFSKMFPLHKRDKSLQHQYGQMAPRSRFTTF